MRRYIVSVGVVLICFAAQNLALAANIKKKNGEVLNGTIRGVIVQTEKVEVKEGSEFPYAVNYFLTNALDIESIDNDSVQAQEGAFRMQLIVTTPKPPDVNQVLRTLLKAQLPEGVEVELVPDGQDGYILSKRKPSNKLVFLSSLPLPEGGMVLISGSQTTRRGTLSASLLGEFRLEGVVPSLTITTKKGVVTVPITDVAPSTSK